MYWILNVNKSFGKYQQNIKKIYEIKVWLNSTYETCFGCHYINIYIEYLSCGDSIRLQIGQLTVFGILQGSEAFFQTLASRVSTSWILKSLKVKHHKCIESSSL